MDIVIGLERDHEAIKQLIEDVKSEYASPEGKLNSFQQLARLVESQAKAEEATVLSFARECSSMRPLALESLEEHVLLEELANKIRQTENDEAWDAKVKVYCDFLERHLEEAEFELIPELSGRLSKQERNDLGRDYSKLHGLCLGAVNQERDNTSVPNFLEPAMNEAGRIGYLFAWLLGVPAWLLFIIFLIRGH